MSCAYKVDSACNGALNNIMLPLYCKEKMDDETEVMHHFTVVASETALQ